MARKSDMRLDLPVAPDAIQLLAPDAASKGLRRLILEAYTGTPVDLLFGRYVFDVEGIDVGKMKQPILFNHDTGQIVGHMERAVKAGGKLQVSGVLSGTGPAAKEIEANSERGFPYQASVYVSPRSETEIAAGETVEVNGREVTGPVTVIKTSILKEVSFVALGADSDTAATVLADQGQALPKETNMTEQEKAAIEKAAMEKAVEAAAKRLEELTAAFPDRPDFILAQFRAGRDVNQAKCSAYDLLLAENKTLAARAQELDAKLAEAVKAAAKPADARLSGASPVTFTPAAEPKDLQAQAKELSKAQGISEFKAMGLLADKDPKAFESWLQAHVKK